MKHGYDPMPDRRCSACGKHMWDKAHVAYAFEPMQMTPRQQRDYQRAMAAYRWAERTTSDKFLAD